MKGVQIILWNGFLILTREPFTQNYLDFTAGGLGPVRISHRCNLGLAGRIGRKLVFYFRGAVIGTVHPNFIRAQTWKSFS